MRRSFSCEVTQRLCVTFSMCVTRCMEQAVLHQLNHNRLELCLQCKGWNSSEGDCVCQGCKQAVWGMVLHVRVALAPRAGNGGNVCSLSSHFCRKWSCCTRSCGWVTARVRPVESCVRLSCILETPLLLYFHQEQLYKCCCPDTYWLLLPVKLATDSAAVDSVSLSLSHSDKI